MFKNSFPYVRSSSFPVFSCQWGTRGPLALLRAGSWLCVWEHGGPLSLHLQPQACHFPAALLRPSMSPMFPGIF